MFKKRVKEKVGQEGWTGAFKSLMQRVKHEETLMLLHQHNPFLMLNA